SHDEKSDFKIPKTFPDLHLFAEKENINTLCLACEFSFKSYRPLFNTYLLTSNEITYMNVNNSQMKGKEVKFHDKTYDSPFVLGEEIIELFENPPEGHWLLMHREHGSMNAKHIVMGASVNYGSASSYQVSIGQNQVTIPNFEKGELRKLYDAMYKLKSQVQATSPRIRYFFSFTGERPHPDSDILDLWLEVYPIIKDHVNTMYFDYLYNYIVPSYSLIQKLEEEKQK